jgi:hypothetical protein
VAVSKDGHPTVTWIVDVLKNRKIEIRPRDSVYRYILILDPAGKLTTSSVERRSKCYRANRKVSLTIPTIRLPLSQGGISQRLLSTGERIQSLWR